MIIISDTVYDVIDKYTTYLVNEGLTTQARALEKKNKIVQAINSSLGGIHTHRPSPYKELGKETSCLLYVYKDAKSKTQWGFAYKQFDENNVIVYHMRNLKLVTDSAQ